MRFINIRPIIRLLIFAIGLLLVASGCGGKPVIIDGSDNSTLNPTGGNPPTDCTSETPVQDLDFRLDSIRGANVIIALDDSGSMTQEIDRVKTRISTFVQELSADTTDNYRVMLVFSMNGVNGSPFPNGSANPFASLIDNQKVFYSNDSTGSRQADVALFQTFATSTFQQIIPASFPLDAGGGLPSSCSGAARYFRPRGLSAPIPGSQSISQCGGGSGTQCDQGLSQVSQSCYAAHSGSTGSTNLSRLLPNVARNIITMSDDDINIAGDFSSASGSGITIYKNLVDKLFESIGADTPTYFHSIVGLTDNSNPPPNSEGIIERLGTEHLAMTALTGGLSADIRQVSYDSVFDNIRTKILLSEQVFNLSCALSNPPNISVTVNGDLLDPSLYSLQNNNTEIRILPAAFNEGQLGQTLHLQIVYN